MIHYITTNGAANRWVANQLRAVHSSGIPFRLHAMRSRDPGFHRAGWAAALREETQTIHPLSAVRPSSLLDKLRRALGVG
jgi:hypothetical protein